MSDRFEREATSKLNSIEGKVSDLARDMDTLRTEVGVRKGRELADQIDSIERSTANFEARIENMSRDVVDMKNTIGHFMREFDEIKRALRAIYQNTDEIERTLFPEERETR